MEIYDDPLKANDNLKLTFLENYNNINGNSLIDNQINNNSNIISLDENIKITDALKEISWIALPTTLFFIALFLMMTINLSFIGHTHKGEDKEDVLGGIGISHLYVNCLYYSIIVGLLSGYETLGSNAFGAKNYYLMGVYLHRAQLIAYLLALIFLIIHFFSSVYIISLFGIDSKVLRYVEEYIKIMMLFVLPDVQFSLNFRHLNIINKSHVNLIILLITLVLHPFWCYIFIINYDLGVKGAAWSIVISQSINAILGVAYLSYFRPISESLFFYNRNSFKGWVEYLKIALPSTFLMCSEWWAFEILSIIAIWISKLDYTVHILLANFNAMLFSITIGFSMAASIITGRTISEKSIPYLKKFLKILYVYAFVFMFCVNLIVFFVKNRILYIYVNDQENIVTKGIEVIPILCINNLSDILQTMLCNVCRGLGKQLIASLCTFINFYITQTSFAIFFGKYLEWGVFGLWMGPLFCNLLSAICFFFVVYFYFDFHSIQKEILKRLEKDRKSISDCKEIKI